MLTDFLILGMYYQFDNIVLPAQEKSRIERFKSFFGFSSNGHDDMQKKCLEIYLSDHRKKIGDGELSCSQLNIPQAANGVVHIFRQLYTQNIYQYYSDTWISEQLPKVYNSYHTVCEMVLLCWCCRHWSDGYFLLLTTFRRNPWTPQKRMDKGCPLYLQLFQAFIP